MHALSSVPQLDLPRFNASCTYRDLCESGSSEGGLKHRISEGGSKQQDLGRALKHRISEGLKKTCSRNDQKNDRRRLMMMPDALHITGPTSRCKFLPVFRIPNPSSNVGVRLLTVTLLALPCVEYPLYLLIRPSPFLPPCRRLACACGTLRPPHLPTVRPQPPLSLSPPLSSSPLPPPLFHTRARARKPGWEPWDGGWGKASTARSPCLKHRVAQVGP